MAIFTYIIQMTLAIAFSYEYYDFDKFQPIKIGTTFLRVMTCVRMISQFSKELYVAVKMLTFLKKSRLHVNVRGKSIMVLLSFFQLSVPFLTLGSLMIKVTQESSAGQITKSFVSLSMITKIDDMFSTSFPKEVL